MEAAKKKEEITITAQYQPTPLMSGHCLMDLIQGDHTEEIGAFERSTITYNKEKRLLHIMAGLETENKGLPMESGSV